MGVVVVVVVVRVGRGCTERLDEHQDHHDADKRANH